MKTTRKNFLRTSAALATSLAIPSFSFANLGSSSNLKVNGSLKNRFDPWIEVLPESIRYNAGVLHNLSGKKPVIAVIKNNGYGLGDINAAKILDDMPEIAGFAAVKTDVCISVKEAGIKKPILHMGMATDADFYDLASNNVQLSIFDSRMRTLLESISKRTKRPVDTHLYIDTGMSRMGIPYHRAMPWIEDIAKSKSINILGSFMGFTEDPEFDKEQLKRLQNLNAKAASKKINMGRLHAASSNAVYHFPEASLDMIRPGISLYGAYPTYPKKEEKIAPLKMGYRLNARVVRVEQLRTGDSVSYGGSYVAKSPVWIAALPIGHADGYLRKATKGAKVLVNGNLYPVIGYVSASHTIIELGNEPKVKVGDLATLVGPDHPEIHPSHLSTITGTSVYDILMHMSARLPKIVL